MMSPSFPRSARECPPLCPVSSDPRTGRTAAALILLVAIAGHAPAAERRPFARPGTPRHSERVRTFDVRHIRAELTLDVKAAEVRGTVTHTITPLHPKLTAVTLDCGPKLKVRGVALGGGTPCEFVHEGQTLKVALDRPYEPGEAIALAVTYAGSPDRGIFFIPPDPSRPDAPPAIWTQGEADETHDWLPCYDSPNDRATSELIVTAPKPMIVVSNGKLIEAREAEKTTTFHWKMDVPHVSYLLSIAAGDFAVYRDDARGLPVEYYVPRAVDEPTARRALGVTPGLIRFFGERTGRAYPYPKYAQVAVPEFIWGGMENISATTLNDRIFRDEVAAREGDATDLVAHELAHQWFGDLLTCRTWSHLWLNEGFATYFAALAKEDAAGEDAFRIQMAATFRSYLDSDAKIRRPIVETRYADPVALFDAVAYAKGACVLHALRGLLGDDAWWAGIRRYLKDNEAKVVETDDFRKAMEAASGRDLGWFFDQWTAKAGHPELKARWRFEDADKTVRVRIDQVQATDDATPRFRLPTTLELADGDADRSIPIVIEGAGLEFVIPAPKAPRMVRIDPKGWLPAVIAWEKPAEEWTYQLAHCPDVTGRVEAARALGRPGANAEAAGALAAAWPREKAPQARAAIVSRLAEVGEPARAALLGAAKEEDAHVRSAALAGLGALKRDDPAEAAMRSAWADPKAAYGVRRAALKALAGWDVKDRDELLERGLATRSFDEVIASAALGQVAGRGGARAREAVVFASRPGQPASLRVEATKAMEAPARDDPELQDALIGLADDRTPQVRAAAWEVLGRLRLPRALPVLEARRTRGPHLDARRLDQAIAALKGDARPDGNVREAEALEREAAELELRGKEVRNRAEALRLKAARALLPAATPRE